MLLIDDRTPPPPPSRPERPVWDPDWRIVGWVAAAVALGVAASVTAGIASFVLVCATLACAAHAVTLALPYGEGLREHRQ
jgi:Protein of unknown function (DUF3325)